MVWQTTAGWRKSTRLSPEGEYSGGLLVTSSISLKNTMNTAVLEWFGPPERNTLRPLCVVLPESGCARESLRELGAESSVCSGEPVVYSERLHFIFQRRRVHGHLVPNRWAQPV